MSGSRSFTSLIARSRSDGTKYWPPQWRSEIWAIVNGFVSAPADMARSVGVGRKRRPSARLALAPVPIDGGDFQAYRGAKPPRFAHRVELECAQILDYYGVPWLY